jgi:putative ABC transport system substrate-binding protein
MRRREFITALAGAATLPFTARAQQSMPVVGFLRSTSLAESAHLVAAFRDGLKEAGFTDGQNVMVEYHSADGRPDRLKALADELVRRQVAVIAGNTVAMLAAKAATTTIPIVFAGGSDPIGQGLVASLNRPGGNVTGSSFFAGVLGAKRLELLRQFVPRAAAIGMIVNPKTDETETERRDVQAAAQRIGQQIIVLDVSSDGDIEAAFATLSQRGAGAALIGSGPFNFNRRQLIVRLSARHGLPIGSSLREFADAGGLMSYGTSIAGAFRQAGITTGRILKGEKPADLPVIQSTKFEFVINLKTAKTLGLEVPPTLLATADEVIE